MSGDFYTVPTSDLRWYIARCTWIVYDESGCDDTSLDDFLTCVNKSNLVGTRFKSGMLESVGVRKKRALKSCFVGNQMLSWCICLCHVQSTFQKFKYVLSFQCSLIRLMKDIIFFTTNHAGFGRHSDYFMICYHFHFLYIIIIYLPDL